MTAMNGGVEREGSGDVASPFPRPEVPEVPDGNPPSAPAAIPDLERALDEFEWAVVGRSIAPIPEKPLSGYDESCARYANARARIVELFAERVRMDTVEPEDVR